MAAEEYWEVQVFSKTNNKDPVSLLLRKGNQNGPGFSQGHWGWTQDTSQFVATDHNNEKKISLR